MNVPVYLPYYVLAGSAAMTAAILAGLRQALVRGNWPSPDRDRVTRASTLVLTGWLGAAIALGLLGVYQAASDRLPTIEYGILVPILIGGVLLWRSGTVGRLLDAVPQSWLVGVQGYRALGGIFLFLYGTGKLPGLFAWPAGLGDLLVGLLAPVVAIAYARGPHENGDLAAAWNIFGLFDLLVAVTTGLLTSPSPLQLFALAHPNELISVFPLVVVPTYLVPASVLLHVASLTKLHRIARQGDAQRSKSPNSER
jgi:hypothetical protein